MAARPVGVMLPGMSMSPVPPQERLFTPAFLALSLAELAYFTAAGLLIPVTPLFAGGPLGTDEVGVGIAVGAFSATALLLRPIAGREADRRGRRPLRIGGALLCAVAAAAHMLVGELWGLIALRLLLGVAEAFFFVAGFAALADLAPPGRAGEALSFNSLSLYLGIAVGPLLGQTLLDRGGFNAAWLGAAVLAVMAAGLTTRIPETGKPGSESAGPASLIHAPTIAPGLALFTGVAAMAGFFAFVPLHAENLDFDRWSIVLLEFGLIVVATRIVFARLPDRVPPFRLGIVALALIAGGLALAGLFPSTASLLVGAAIMAVGVAFTTPAFFAAILSRVEPTQRGAASGTASVFIDLAFGGGPVLFGLVAASGTIPFAFGAGAAVAAAGALGTGVLAFRAAGAAATQAARPT